MASIGPLGCTAGARADPTAPRLLGGFPICEASAAAAFPCSESGRGSRCILVGDNETHDRLYSFRVDPEGVLVEPRPIELRSASGLAEIGDIEAVAAGAGAILVLGSHSRKSWRNECERSKKRLRFATMTESLGVPVRIQERRVGKEKWKRRLRERCRTELIPVADAESASQMADDVCREIGASDKSAGGEQGACEASFNIEGAVVVAGATGNARTWIGLRSPLVAGKASLLRLESTEALRFDGVSFIDLGGRGIRALASSSRWLWGIDGPVQDSRTEFRLWRTRLRNLASGTSIGRDDIEIVASLPPSSEGLALDCLGRRAFVVIDGRTGEQNCTEPARQLTLPIPSCD